MIQFNRPAETFRKILVSFLQNSPSCLRHPNRHQRRLLSRCVDPLHIHQKSANMSPTSLTDFDTSIKADRPLTCDTLNTPWLLTNRQFQWTGNSRHNYHWLNSANRVLISTCSAHLVQTGEQFFTVWPWPSTLTCNTRLAKVKVDPHAKNQGQRRNGSNRRAPTDKRTDMHTDATKCIISPATRSIISPRSRQELNT